MFEAKLPKTTTVKNTTTKVIADTDTGYASEGVIMNKEKFCWSKTKQKPIKTPENDPATEIKTP